MKKLLIVFAILLVANLGMAQSNSSKSPSTSNNSAASTVTGAEISFAKKTIDYGTLHVGDVKTIEMVYTNTGKKPLILDNVTTNCDCTEVDWSKKPVMPGKTGSIKVTYTAKHTGLISKWVTVMSNAETDRVVLKTSGEVK